MFFVFKIHDGIGSAINKQVDRDRNSKTKVMRICGNTFFKIEPFRFFVAPGKFTKYFYIKSVLVWETFNYLRLLRRIFPLY